MTDGISTDLRLICGGAYGFINQKSKKYELTTPHGIMDDVERSIVYFKNDGGILRYNQFGLSTPLMCDGGIDTNVGGKAKRLELVKKSCDHFNEKYSKYGDIVDNKLEGVTFKLKKNPKNK